MGIRRHRFLFNTIAFFYRWFFKGQVKNYTRIIREHIYLFDDKPGAKVLDLGCGSGAFARALENTGFEVTGVDLAPKMVKAGRSRDLNCHIGDVTSGLDYSSDSFDIVTAAYAAHGLAPELRTLFYREALRLARTKVIFYDYPQFVSFPEALVEFFEGRGYFSFVTRGLEEMRRVFPKVRVLPTTERRFWYVCDVRGGLYS
jgi:SAM-dependent methyltransferase